MYQEKKDSIMEAAKAYRAAHNTTCDMTTAENITAETGALQTLVVRIADYNNAVTNDAYEAIAATEKPFFSAVESVSYGNLCEYKEKYETLPDKSKGKKFDDVTISFDEKEFYDLGKLDTLAPDNGTFAARPDWAARAMALHLPLMAARVQATGLDKAKFRKAYDLKVDKVTTECPNENRDKMEAFVVNLAGTGEVSKEAARRLVQYAIDSIILDPDEKGLNKYKVLTTDARFVIDGLASYDARRHQTKIGRKEIIYKLLFDVLGRVIFSRAYDLRA